MKRNICLMLLLWTTYISFAGKPDKFTLIDQRARSIGYYPLKELAQKLTAPYSDEESKVRSVFVWIASHIDYDVEQLNSSYKHDYTPFRKIVDSEKVTTQNYWTYAWAYETLYNCKGVCGGYAALFKVICDYSGLQSVVISGNARWPQDVGKTSVTNHNWNAVMINCQWKLMDVTWASGNVSGNLLRFIRKLNFNYYDIAPGLLILDHYPDNFQWALLPEVIPRKQYEQSVYMHSDLDANMFPVSYSPKNGVINTKVGDFIAFELEVPGKLFSLSVEDELKDDYTYYDPAKNETLPESANEVLVKKKKSSSSSSYVTKAPSLKNKQATDDIMDYVNSEADMPDNAKQLTEQKTIVPVYLNRGHYYRDGKKIKFSYLIKRSGKYTLSISWNLSPLMVYAINAQ